MLKGLQKDFIIEKKVQEGCTVSVTYANKAYMDWLDAQSRPFPLAKAKQYRIGYTVSTQGSEKYSVRLTFFNAAFLRDLHISYDVEEDLFAEMIPVSCYLIEQNYQDDSFALIWKSYLDGSASQIGDNIKLEDAIFVVPDVDSDNHEDTTE